MSLQLDTCFQRQFQFDAKAFRNYECLSDTDSFSMDLDTSSLQHCQWGVQTFLLLDLYYGLPKCVPNGN